MNESTKPRAFDYENSNTTSSSVKGRKSMEPKEALQPTLFIQDKTVTLPTVEDDDDTDVDSVSFRNTKRKVSINQWDGLIHTMDPSHFCDGQIIFNENNTGRASSTMVIDRSENLHEECWNTPLKRGFQSLNEVKSQNFNFTDNNTHIEVLQKNFRTNSSVSSHTVWCCSTYDEARIKFAEVAHRKRDRCGVSCHPSSSYVTAVESERPFYTNILPIHSVRIGSDFQAYVRRALPIFRKNSKCYDTEPILIWDHQRAADEERNGENIFGGFLPNTNDFNLLLLHMEALHRGKYKVRAAAQEFISIYDQSLLLPLNLNDFESSFQKYFEGDHFKLTKDFRTLSNKLDCPMQTVLVNYYRWKKSNSRSRMHYIQGKADRKNKKESDECKICDDGGNLIVCELCRDSYHLECLTPPLFSIPSEDWYCSKCDMKSPSKFRRLSVINKSPSLTNDGIDLNDRRSTIVPSQFKLSFMKCIHKDMSGVFSSFASGISSNKPFLVPANMKWDSRGFWVSDDDGLSDEFETDSFKVTDQRGVLTVSSATVSGQVYDVYLPITSEGLLIYIERKTGKFTTFQGYRLTSSGFEGPAQKYSVFKAPGDWILAVDNINCDNKSFHEVKELLKLAKPGKSFRLLKMFHPII